MPSWITKLLPVFAKTSWGRVFAVAAWLFTSGNARLHKNLPEKERRELTKLLTRSKGKPSNLTGRDKTRLRRLVYKAATGHFPT